jgi:hypothetical protein
MEEKHQVVKKRVRIKNKPFCRRRIKILNLLYRDLSIFIVLYIIMVIGLFHKVILQFFGYQ